MSDSVTMVTCSDSTKILTLKVNPGKYEYKSGPKGNEKKIVFQ